MPHSRCEPPVPTKIRIPQTGPLPHMYVLSDFEALKLENEGLRLWQALRRVRDWHASPPDGFSPPFLDVVRTYEDVDPALRPSLAALDCLLRDPNPDFPAVEAVAFACLNAALWAEERGAYRTSVGFLHAAEDVDPDNPHYAYNLGRVARKMALYEEAEAWLKWSHFVARSQATWEVATLALSGLGNLYRQRGNLPKARRFHEAARRMARLKDLRTLEGDALYDLAVMSFSLGEADAGVEYSRQALRVYGPGHTEIYRLASDIAWLWMDEMGEFENALHVFTALLHHIWKPSVRLIVLANLGRAAAAVGLKEVFESSWIDVWRIVCQSMNQEGHAAALVQVARGAGNLGYWDRAELAAREALAIARRRKEGEIIIAAEAILNAVTLDLIGDSTIDEVFKDRRRSMTHDDQASELASLLANAMRARRDGAPESPTHALVHAGG